jgi:diamine N-acetyltransferase
MSDITLNSAGIEDIESISQLATITWNQHYTSIISQKQINYMLNLMYNKQSLTEQLVQKGHQFYFIQQSETRLGFISVNQQENNHWFINKFYINQTVAAKGIGTKAFQKLLNIIKPSKISLTVNRQNYKSINFYFKLGFKIERVADFDIGNGYVMNDFVMVW